MSAKGDGRIGAMATPDIQARLFRATTDARTRVDGAWPLLEDPVRIVRLEAARAIEEYKQARRYVDELVERYPQYAQARALRMQVYQK